MEQRIQSNFGQNRQESPQAEGGDAWAGKHLPTPCRLAGSTPLPPQTLTSSTSPAVAREHIQCKQYNYIFYIMPLQSLHFYRKENHRALKWGLSGALSAATRGWALADPVPLQLLTCPQRRQKRCHGHGSQQLLCHSGSNPVLLWSLPLPLLLQRALWVFAQSLPLGEWLLHRTLALHCNVLQCCDMWPQSSICTWSVWLWLFIRLWSGKLQTGVDR